LYESSLGPQKLKKRLQQETTHRKTPTPQQNTTRRKTPTPEQNTTHGSGWIVASSLLSRS
jgi:hypothetical protein